MVNIIPERTLLIMYGGKVLFQTVGKVELQSLTELGKVTNAVIVLKQADKAAQVGEKQKYAVKRKASGQVRSII